MEAGRKLFSVDMCSSDPHVKIRYGVNQKFDPKVRDQEGGREGGRDGGREETSQCGYV